MTLKIGKSSEFYSKLYRLAKRKKFPLKAMFELTYKCNFDCIHCYVLPERNRKELSTEQVKEILRQLKEAGCFHIGFTGGEPLLRTDIFQILEYTKLLGFRISLITNGFLINAKATDRIASLGISLNRVDVSVLGASLELFELITQKRGSYRRVMSAIQLLKDRKVDVQVKSVLMNLNKDEFLRIREIAKKHKTLFRYSSNVIPMINGDMSPTQFQVEPEEVSRVARLILDEEGVVNNKVFKRENSKAKRTSDRKIDFRDRASIFKCGAGQSEITISAYGTIKLCPLVSYPNYDILNGSLREGWGKLKRFVRELKRSKENYCKDCVLGEFCQWCPARGWLISRDFNKCAKIDREIALSKARHSPIWKKIALIWEMQKKRWY